MGKPALIDKLYAAELRRALERAKQAKRCVFCGQKCARWLEGTTYDVA